MRTILSLALLLLFVGAVCPAAPRQAGSNRHVASEPSTDCSSFLPYAADPNHLWNRVHRRLFERRDAQGKAWGCDEVDPLLWDRSKHVLAGAPYAETLRVLDEFTSRHAEQLIHDPLPRAIFQHDLWAVFDWLARRNDDYPQERAQVERRLTTTMKAVALTPSEIQRLPDNYAQLHGSTTNDGPALPDAAGGWLLIGRDDVTPAAAFHVIAFPRSLFLVYLKLPPGTLEASRYLESARAYSRQRRKQEDCQLHECNPPQFPVGTELALVRRALLIDTAGRLVVSPITESVQLRKYVNIPTGSRFDFDGSTQQVAEFQLTRRTLRQGEINLRRVGEQETQFAVFATHGIDDFEDGDSLKKAPGVALQRCHGCHQGTGARSFTTYSRAQFERDRLFVLVHASKEDQEEAATIKALKSRDDWRLLQRLWQGSSEPGPR